MEELSFGSLKIAPICKSGISTLREMADFEQVA
jgi:hypothetical protein